MKLLTLLRRRKPEVEGGKIKGDTINFDPINPDKLGAGSTDLPEGFLNHQSEEKPEKN